MAEGGSTSSMDVSSSVTNTGLIQHPSDQPSLTSQHQPNVSLDQIEKYFESKSPISCLMEYASKMQCRVTFEESGNEDPVAKFACLCTVNGIRYPRGIGNSKKDAKTDAARKAYIQILSVEAFPAEQSVPVVSIHQQAASCGELKPVPQDLITAFMKETKSSISCVNEYASKMNYKVIFDEREDPVAKFICVCTINGISYPQGIGKSKKHAKTEAARIAFTSVSGLSQEHVNIRDSKSCHGDLPSIQQPQRVPVDLIKEFKSGKQPVSCINEYAARMKVTVGFKEEHCGKGDSVKKFSCVCAVDGVDYSTGFGYTKKEAKTEAARIAFTDIAGSDLLEVGTEVGADRSLNEQTVAKFIASEPAHEAASDETTKKSLDLQQLSHSLDGTDRSLNEQTVAKVIASESAHEAASDETNKSIGLQQLSHSLGSMSLGQKSKESSPVLASSRPNTSSVVKDVTLNPQLHVGEHTSRQTPGIEPSPSAGSVYQEQRSADAEKHEAESGCSQ
ncbi:uncharacterized protein LOC121379431 isoform X2 [Gigantopelta aegis]|uniref:uncharacterized protein LOC121379431 isoform X2 n=1 Tax=Gigantopelta aegis TaxID=1735272 RepID=UPI001B8887F8|nr:uncharacterized protein LOC121379431 isoform X2 [Gigantopelta aegis]